MQKWRSIAAVTLLLLLAACLGVSDGEVADASGTAGDGGARPPEAGTVADTGVADGSHATDAGVVDGAHASDAGAVDGSVASDAGAAGDGGDAGAEAMDGGGSPACSTGTAQDGDVTVNLSGLQQKISGFGTCTAWAGDFRSPRTDPDMLWSTTSGAGFSLHRIRIGRGSTSETTIAKAAVARGVKIWAAPWEVKDSDISGNPPKLVNPQDWASTLASFVTTMKNAGVPIYAVSAENEPDSKGLNATTWYTPTELATFVGTYLGPALANTGAKVMAPETMNWYGIGDYLAALQSNADAWKYTDIVATHEYGGTPKAYPQIAQAGKEFWETEIYDTHNDNPSSVADGIDSGLRIGKIIHEALTVANVNAWHFWWVWASGNGGLFNTDTNVWSKRLWVGGNFSRFIRPGFHRVSTSENAPSGVLVSAYKNPADGTVVVVAINNNNSATQFSAFLSGAAPCTMTPWVTSATDNIASKSPLTVTSARFTGSLGAKSVTTFVGKP
jgi:glucuronoarabinoxylan endo-1,4-beta-xylanase